jgi:hypothetical protein
LGVSPIEAVVGDKRIFNPEMSEFITSSRRSCARSERRFSARPVRCRAQTFLCNSEARLFGVVDLVNWLDARTRSGKEGRTALMRLDFTVSDELG